MTETVVISGGGLTGLGVLTRAVADLKNSYNKPNIVWLDAAGAFGRSDTFAKGEVPYRLNNPRYMQSYRSDDPEHYADWADTNVGVGGRHDFDLRSKYGGYLASHASNQVAIANKYDIRTTCLDAEATNVVRTENNTLAVTLDNGRRVIEATHFVAATGPARNRDFDYLLGQRNYVPHPLDTAALQGLSQASTPQTTVVIRGNGASMMDAIVALEHFNYKGTYISISNSKWDSWVLEPAKYDPRVVQPPLDLTKDKIDQVVREMHADKMETAFAHLYDRERTRDPRIGFLHILKQFPFEDIADKLRLDGEQRLSAQLLAYQAHCFSNPVSPQTARLKARLRQTGRLQTHVAKIRAVEATTDGLVGIIEGGKTFSIENFINAAPYQKGIGDGENRSQLFTSLLRNDLIAVGRNNIVTTDDKGLASPGVFVVGAASHTGKTWGVESFRDKYDNAGAAIAADVSYGLKQPVAGFHPNQIFQRPQQSGAYYAHH